MSNKGVPALIAALALTSASSFAQTTQDGAARPSTRATAQAQAKCMNQHIRGTFDVKMAQQPPSDKAAEAGVGRMTLDKRYQGDLDATGVGEMIAFLLPVNSGGYAAIEKVTGTLCGKKGSFMIQHEGIMTRGDGKLKVAILPDSGTDALVGISGTMTIEITGGKHFYELDFKLP